MMRHIVNSNKAITANHSITASSINGQGNRTSQIPIPTVITPQ
jgi:hypothetical protein